MKRFFLAITSCLTSSLFPHVAGTNSDTLDPAVRDANAAAGADTTVVLGSDVDLISPAEASQNTQVRALNANGSFEYVAEDITVEGKGFKLLGNDASRGFFVGGESSSSSGSVTIISLEFNENRAQGGNGMKRGGGGLGAGGGLFVGENTVVTIKDCCFIDCTAKGGDGGATTSFTEGGGGGGMHGIGNAGGGLIGGGGGGYGGNGLGGGGGASDFNRGNAIAAGGFPGRSFDGGGTGGETGVGGRLAGLGGDSIDGGFGGGGGAGVTGGSGNFGGDGGFGGGGGGQSNSDSAGGGNGGFGGGGGAASEGASLTGGTPGDGGFGAGGGSAPAIGISTVGLGGFGGGDGPLGGAGGKGAGFGGAVFIDRGGSLTVQNSLKLVGNTTAPGDSGTANTDATAGFGALGNDFFMMSSSDLIFDITSNVNLPNPIRGDQGNGGGGTGALDGGLTKNGSALLSLTGENTYTGTTTANAGELRISGSVITPVVVNSGATLSGSFTIKNGPTTSGDLTNSGLVCPGINGTGQINLEGTLTNNANGIYGADIRPSGSNDKILLTAGSANLSGTMDVIIPAGNYIVGTQYLVIDGTTGGTEFDNITKSGAFSNLVQIEVTYNGGVIITIVGGVLFASQIQSGPAKEVAKCLVDSSLIPGSDLSLMIEVLGNLSDSNLNTALVSLSPARFGALEWINARNNSYIANLLSEHQYELCCSVRDCCSCCLNGSFWINFYGSAMHNKKKLDFLRRYNNDSVGVIAGADYCCDPCLYLGGAVGYTHTDLLWKNQGGTGHLNSYYGALYGSYHPCFVDVDVSVIGGATDQDLDRRIVFLNVDRVAKSDFWSWFFTAHLGFSKELGCLRPYVLGDYHYYHRMKFKESGANSLDLDVRSKDQHFMRAEGGINYFYEVQCECFCYAPYLGISYVGEFPLHSSKQKANFANETCKMDVLSYDSAIHLASPQAGVRWTHCNGASFNVGYNGLFNSHTQIHQFEARFEWVF